MLAVVWLDDKEHRDVFLKRPINTGASDTISYLAQRVNQHWIPPNRTERPLEEFADLLPRTNQHRAQALALSGRYARLIRRALATGDRNAFRPIFAALETWAASRQDPDTWAAAVWHAVHRKRARGTGSLAFNAFPAQVMAALHHQPDLPHRIAIVGLPYNAYADDLDQFGGHPFTVRIVEEPLNGQLRSAAYKNKKGLGYISTEAPL